MSKGNLDPVDKEIIPLRVHLDGYSLIVLLFNFDAPTKQTLLWILSSVSANVFMDVSDTET